MNIKLSQIERENAVIFADKNGIIAIAGITADARLSVLNCNTLYVIRKKEKIS